MASVSRAARVSRCGFTSRNRLANAEHSGAVGSGEASRRPRQLGEGLVLLRLGGVDAGRLHLVEGRVALALLGFAQRPQLLLRDGPWPAGRVPAGLAHVSSTSAP